MERDGYDVAVLGGGLVGSMAALMLRRRGLTVCVLESRKEGRPQKVVVGEALTEGTSVFLRHELGLGPWLKENAFRKFGFDFLVLPRHQDGDEPPGSDMNRCHELLLSLTPLERIPEALSRLIPTFHVERPGLNNHVAELAARAGARFLHGASVEQVALGEAAPRGTATPFGREVGQGDAQTHPVAHRVHFARDGQPGAITCRFVLDASGRRTVLGRQLGITHPVASLKTASVWNRFTSVEADPAFWRTFHGVDRRRHTIHFCGPGFWIWWIHQSDLTTSVGCSFDTEQHQPDTKADDRGFHEMVRKFPAVARALEGATPLEPFQFYAHLPYRSEHWLSTRGYALVGDAAWFTDALYSIGIETACRQLTAAVPLIVRRCKEGAMCARTVDRWNQEFDYCATAVARLNAFKYHHGWHRPHVVVQTALYELGEIAELYHLQDPSRWRPEVLAKHYRLQWGTPARLRRLVRFQEAALGDGDRDLDDDAPLLRKALLPGRTIYRATWPLWNLPRATPYFFHLTRAWAYAERAAQRLRLFPDGLSWMASNRDYRALARLQRPDARAATARTHAR
jgi:flavin-dependent dehydrogenase